MKNISPVTPGKVDPRVQAMGCKTLNVAPYYFLNFATKCAKDYKSNLEISTLTVGYRVGIYKKVDSNL